MICGPRGFFPVAGVAKQFYALKDSRIIHVLRCVMHCDETDYAAAVTAN